jgi:predicted TIM-barrel fold metal-dependent hydrolase
MTRSKLPYLIMDADEHSQVSFDDIGAFIDPEFRDKAPREVTLDDGTTETYYAGRPARLRQRGSQHMITLSHEKLSELGIRSDGDDLRIKELATDGNSGGGFVPGALLNRLNPLKGLDEHEREEYVARYSRMRQETGTPEMRVKVMDEQGIDSAVNYLNLGNESNYAHDIPALYATQHAVNRWCAEVWGFVYADRLFTPPFISLVEVEPAVAELEYAMAQGAKVIQISTGPSMHRSLFRPELDPFWARVNEAGLGVCTHVVNSTFYGAQGREWDEEEVVVGDMDAFQWTMYHGDRPAYETVAAAILQGLFNRFPNVKLLLSEQGTLWVPYIVRKMDHAFLMGRRATWGKLEMRPSEYFRQHCFVAPFPEENVDRVAEVVGVEPIVFGSDFPHGEGLPEPELYLGQLENFDEAETKMIMRDNLARYLGRRVDAAA